MMNEEEITSEICSIYKVWFGKEPKDDAEKKEFERDLVRIEMLERVLHAKREGD